MSSPNRQEVIRAIDSLQLRSTFVASYGQSPEDFFEQRKESEPFWWEHVLHDLGLKNVWNDLTPSTTCDRVTTQ